MSHTPQRKEKNCLNCGTEVIGRFCHVCGQENVEPKETFWHMFVHFFNDITHFDGKFFTTLKDLLFKPGFLSREYMLGKRVRYLHPVRLYIFTSAVFFLLFFSFFGINTHLNLNEPISREDRLETLDNLQAMYHRDTSNHFLKAATARFEDTTRPITRRESMALYSPGPSVVELNGRAYESIRQYDSIQRVLPDSSRDGWIMRGITRQLLHLNEKFSADPEEAVDKFSEVILHRLPYMLFVSLPLFALLLKLVYFRRKEYYYADHGVFTIHLYVFTFILMALVFALDKIKNLTHIQSINWLVVGLFLLDLFYLYKAMRYFYQQKRAKTILKFILLTISSLLMIITLLALFIFFAAFTF